LSPRYRGLLVEPFGNGVLQGFSVNVLDLDLFLTDYCKEATKQHAVAV
jgi:hypothetical protein